MANVTLSLTVVKPIKDAARAAKKGMDRVMQKFKEFTVTRLLDLPEFVVVGCEIEQRGIQEIVHMYCLHPHQVAICPRCRQMSTMVHDEKERCVRDLDIWGKCTFLHFSRRRFAPISSRNPKDLITSYQKNFGLASRQLHGYRCCNTTKS